MIGRKYASAAPAMIRPKSVAFSACCFGNTKGDRQVASVAIT